MASHPVSNTVEVGTSRRRQGRWRRPATKSPPVQILPMARSLWFSLDQLESTRAVGLALRQQEQHPRTVGGVETVRELVLVGNEETP